MRGVVTQAIVLARVNYGEADRIITSLTPGYGKIRLIAKGVRKPRSKLAGGIELFSISDITFIPGKKEIGTLTSSRLQKHYGGIVQDIERTIFAHDALKLINKITEDNADEEYFLLANELLAAINEKDNDLSIIRLWLNMQLLKLAGHSPNLRNDDTGKGLASGQTFTFSLESMHFVPSEAGSFHDRHIKLLRLALGADSPKLLLQVKDAEEVLADCLQLAKTMAAQFIRL